MKTQWKVKNKNWKNCILIGTTTTVVARKMSSSCERCVQWWEEIDGNEKKKWRHWEMTSCFAKLGSAAIKSTWSSKKKMSAFNENQCWIGCSWKNIVGWGDGLERVLFVIEGWFAKKCKTEFLRSAAVEVVRPLPLLYDGFVVLHLFAAGCVKIDFSCSLQLTERSQKEVWNHSCHFVTIVPKLLDLFIFISI